MSHFFHPCPGPMREHQFLDFSVSHSCVVTLILVQLASLLPLALGDWSPEHVKLSWSALLCFPLRPSLIYPYSVVSSSTALLTSVHSWAPCPDSAQPPTPSSCLCMNFLFTNSWIHHLYLQCDALACMTLEGALQNWLIFSQFAPSWPLVLVVSTHAISHGS